MNFKDKLEIHISISRHVPYNCVGLAAVIAEEEMLSFSDQELFINFMAARFPDERSECYIREWAVRFAKNPLPYCDRHSAAVLLQLQRELSKEVI